MSSIKVPTCYASCSIGYKPEHNVPAKLKAISAAGFEAIELSMPDLVSFAQEHLGKDVTEKDYAHLCVAGQEVKRLCAVNGLKILVLQPFANFEGWPQGSSERKDAFDRAKGWLEIMQAVGTDMLQVGSSDSPNISSSQEYLAHDLAELADLLVLHNFRISYENWCWASHAPTWREIWDIVQKANRENIGLCLDTFQTAGGEWADPTTQSGIIESIDRAQLEKKFKQSLKDLSSTIPPEKIYFLQISDAYRMEPPLSSEVQDGLRPRARWSHDYRPLPYDGGYLPVVEVAAAVLRTGFRGWFSTEIFDGKLEAKSDADGMESFARKAMAAHEKLMENIKL